MAKLTQIQKDINKSISTAKKGAKGLVTMYGLLLARYWNEDSQSPDNIEYFINGLVDLKRTQEAARKLLQMYLPVEVKGKKDKHVISNRKGVTKGKKEVLKAECIAFAALELTSLLNHSSLKVEVAFEWNDNAKKSAESFMMRRIENGVPMKDLLDILHSAAKKVADKQAAVKAA